ncbi:hypothetical protein D049_3062A, partial [Vibrio parahaemolyticus VPTS-2010]
MLFSYSSTVSQGCL